VPFHTSVTLIENLQFCFDPRDHLLELIRLASCLYLALWSAERSIFSFNFLENPVFVGRSRGGETPDQETGRVVSFRKHSMLVIDYRDRGGTAG
jgi:hypothetical protein